jgi:hypothetical protein
VRSDSSSDNSRVLSILFFCDVRFLPVATRERANYGSTFIKSMNGVRDGCRRRLSCRKSIIFFDFSSPAGTG